MPTTTKQLINRYRIRADVGYGAPPRDDDDSWPNNPWTVTLKFGRRRITSPFYMGIGLSGEPEADDVLDSLLLDASGADYHDFEDFCAEFGYDTDSRRAERVYKGCQQASRKLHQFLNGHYDEFMEAERG